MRTYPLRPREIYPYGILRCKGNRPFDLVEGAKKMEDDICPKCVNYHENCPKPDISENMAVAICRDFKKLDERNKTC